MKRVIDLFPLDEIARFCRRWRIQELAVFGSALREDFRPESDIDLIVTFEDGADWSLLDHIKMQEELRGILGREVDLVTKRAVERSHNWVRRKEILRTATIIYPKHRVTYEPR